MNVIETQPMPEQPEIDDVMAMFDDPAAPKIAIEIDFNEMLGRAAIDEADTEAFAAIMTSFEIAKATGDLQQIQQMAMVLGATACMHDHLQAFANEIASSYETDIFGNKHEHEDEDDDDDDDTPRVKRLKSKAKPSSHTGHRH